MSYGGTPGAMVALHFAGHPAEVEALASAAGLPLDRVVEDAAHAVGTVSGGRLVGALSAATCPGPAATPAHPLLGVQHCPAQPDRGRGDLHALGGSLATPSGLLYLRPETHPGQSGPSSWYRTASDAASSREWTPSLVSTASMRVRTVAGEIWSLAAIAEVFSPSTRKPRQSRSRDVR